MRERTRDDLSMRKRNGRDLNALAEGGEADHGTAVVKAPTQAPWCRDTRCKKGAAGCVPLSGRVGRHV